MEMMYNPSIQSLAQKELDSICPDRLPTADDRDSLPYIEAVLKEVLRSHPPLYQGVPHRLDEEEVFEGVVLPKHSVLISNIRYVKTCFFHSENRAERN